MEQSQSSDPALLKRAKDALEGAQNVLVITGAGISAESGVPTFRGEGGYWRNRHYSDLANPDAFAADPMLVWEWYCERRQKVAACAPNDAHRTLAEWSNARNGVTLVTQNVDGLHERAGHLDVVRLHGSLWKNRCTSCGIEREEEALSYTALPSSLCCEAPERPAIVWFDESISRETIKRSLQAVWSAQVVLVIGTSGVVMPAVGFVRSARERGATIIDVNPEGSSIDAHIAIAQKAGDVIPQLLS